MTNAIKYAAMLCLALAVNAAAENSGKETGMTQDNSGKAAVSGPFAPGNKLPETNFTGSAWLNMLVPDEKIYNTPIGNVTFAPGARNSWHKHSGGQILLATSGEGFYQEKDKPARLVRAGETVLIPPDTVHWHGATSDTWFAHLAVTPNARENKVTWLEPVTDADYAKVNAGRVPPAASDRISATARKNHERLFPGHKSTLKVTDPELIALFDNFAFDEVMNYGDMDERTRMIITLGSMIAAQALGEYKVMLGAAVNVGVTPVEAKEVLYQSVPYVGMAKVFDFLHATNEVLAARGVKLPLEGQSTTTPENRYEKGLATQKAIFGERIDKMYKDSPEDELHIQKYLSDNCFGDYYTRKGLDLKTRELLTFSMLLAMGGTESQMKGHVQGNLNVGNDRKVLLTAVTQLLPYVGYPRTLNAIKSINEVTGK